MIRTLALLLAAAPAGAASDVLPLRHGLYVARGTPCVDPPFAMLRVYDGRGLATAHSRDCRARIVGRRRGALRVDNGCIGAGAGPAPRDVERLTMRLAGGSAFVLNGAAFRHCPTMPDWLRPHGPT